MVECFSYVTIYVISYDIFILFPTSVSSKASVTDTLISAVTADVPAWSSHLKEKVFSSFASNRII